MPSPLEPSAEQLRLMGETALEYLIGFVEGLPEAPAGNVERGLEVAERLHGSPPERGIEFEEAMRRFADAAEHSYEPAGPGYLAFIPGGGLVTAALSTMLAAGLNRFVNLASTAPALVQMEQDVATWLCDLFELPAGSQGILTTGGSMANLSAIVAARRAMLPEDFLHGTMYVSEQAHASIAKASSIAGFPERSVRHVRVTGDLRMDTDALAERVTEDRAAGLLPFCVVANAGTTNTGAIDPIDDIATLCVDEGLWLHVDAAYGGFFQLTERGRKRFRGIERADSITLDPHKGMFLPYGTGSLVVRDGETLRAAHSLGAPAYLQDVVAGGEVLPNFTELSPELSREFRGLRVWLPLQVHGVDAFRRALDEKLDLARLVYDELVGAPGLQVLWQPELSIVAFRSTEGDDASRELLDRINAGKRVFLSSTTIDDGFVLRIAILSHRTHRDRIDEAIEIVRREAAALVD